MPEIQAAMIGAAASAFLMVLSNMSNRRERDIREIFNRINQIEKAVARLEGNSRINWLLLGLKKHHNNHG